MIEALIFIFVAAVAGVVGWSLARRRSRRIVDGARVEARRLEREAAEVSALMQREEEVRCRDQRVQIERAAAAEEAVIKEELRLLGELLERRQRRIEQRRLQLEERSAVAAQRAEELKQAKAEARKLRDEAKQTRRSASKKLEHQASLTAAEMTEEVVERMVEETRGQCADRLRNLESTGAEEFARQAKRVMGIVMQRYSGHCVRERAAMTMPLEAGAAAKLQGPAAGDAARVSELTRVHLSFADDGSSVRLESGDGVAREVCRRSLARVVAEDKIGDPEKLVEGISAGLLREIRQMGNDAFGQLRLAPPAEEIVELVGKLNFRTSYTQNQWRHAIEAAQLGGMMAEELGLDPSVARRGALMHDIGKALTHEVEGSHALIGAEIARRSGESEVVVNAIGFHHGEESAQSAYAPLVAAADAMSGGRPGARREMVESYGDRIGDLEKIASSFDGVTRVHAVQAGRELRVQVDDAHVADAQIDALSEAIAQKISAELTFPGQIRVTVIREFCAVEYAS